jgi:hypothetical protein
VLRLVFAFGSVTFPCVFVQYAHTLRMTHSSCFGFVGPAGFASEEGHGHARFAARFLIQHCHHLLFDFFRISARSNCLISSLRALFQSVAGMHVALLQWRIWR